MENSDIYANNKTKYLIFGALSFAVLLLIVYTIFYFFLQNNKKNEPIASVSPTQYLIPTFTPVPTISNSPQTTPSEDYNKYNSPVDQKILDLRDKYEILNNPDIIVSNNSPYSNEYFLVNTEVVDVQPEGYYKIILYELNNDSALVEQKFRDWLKSLRLPEESIKKLVIEKRPIAKEVREP